MKRIQSFDDPEETIIPLLQNYLGMSLIVQDDDSKYITIPFFFSREPAYGLPILAVGGVEVSFEIDNIEILPRVLIDLEVLHSRQEVEEIRRTRSHQTEHLAEGIDYLKTPKWIYMNCFWRKLPGELIKNGKARLLHDGGVDEEIKGVFWKIPSNKNRKVKLEFHGDRTVPLINFHPCAILSEIQLKTKILPTTSGSFLTDPSVRQGYGGIMLSKYVDSVDCEAGLSPRNGELILEFSNEYESNSEDIEVYLFTSRDAVIILDF